MSRTHTSKASLASRNFAPLPAGSQRYAFLLSPQVNAPRGLTNRSFGRKSCSPSALLPCAGTISFVTAAVLTVSDRCFRGEREDLSGPAVAALLEDAGYLVALRRTLPDEQPLLEQALREAAGSHALVVTTGGTGLAARDVTPEATRAVCERLLDGLPERMRAAGLRDTPYAVLSRSLAGTLGRSLILNLPGAPRGAQTSLQAVLPVLSHALQLMRDPNAPHTYLSAQSPDLFRPQGEKTEKKF